jgi:hypothetical protein
MCTTGAPGAPTNLTAVAPVGTQVNLAWMAGSGAVTGYRVERSTDGGTTWAQIATGVLGTSYTDNTVLPGVTYDYRVFAYNAQGDSAPSNVATVTTPGGLPAAPTGLWAEVTPPSPNPPIVTLHWTDNAANEQGFIVERAPDTAGAPGAWAVIATIPTPDTQIYVDNTVAPKMTYWYQVAAYNADGKSGYSNQVSAITPGQVPEAPANLRVTNRSKNTVSLAWFDLSNNESGFYLERAIGTAIGPGNVWVVIPLPANTIKYKDTGLVPGTFYYYQVQAWNADGASAYSNMVGVQTKGAIVISPPRR